MNFDKETKRFIVDSTPKEKVEYPDLLLSLPVEPPIVSEKKYKIHTKLPYLTQWIKDIVKLHNLRERYKKYHPEEVEMIAAIDWMIDWYRNPQD